MIPRSAGALAGHLRAGVVLDSGEAAHFIRRAGSSYRSDERDAARPRPAAGTGCACKITHSIGWRDAGLGGEWRQARPGETDVARRVLRLATLAILFLLAVMTGMLLPPSWVVSR
jgi:hypothetical protein